jgi:hypothetical protein
VHARLLVLDGNDLTPACAFSTHSLGGVGSRSTSPSRLRQLQAEAEANSQQSGGPGGGRWVGLSGNQRGGLRAENDLHESESDAFLSESDLPRGTPVMHMSSRACVHDKSLC